MSIPLNADDIAAMKMADTVSLHLNNHTGSLLRLHLRSYGEPVIYSKRQQQLFTNTRDVITGERGRDIIPKAVAFGYDDGDDGRGWRWEEGQERIPSCFDMISTNDAWFSIVRTLRVGDELTLQWSADNNNDLVREAGLHVDQVSLIVTPAREKAPKNVWHLRTSVGRNNSARMIKRH